MIKIEQKPEYEIVDEYDPYVALRAAIIMVALDDLLNLERAYKQTGSKDTALLINKLNKDMHTMWFKWLCEPFDVDYMINLARRDGLKNKKA